MAENSFVVPAKPVFKLNIVDDQNKFQPLPVPKGVHPFHLNIAGVVKEPPLEKIVFHLVGDTGSSKQPAFQRLVAAQMVNQFSALPSANNPLFLFHLGDVVYHFGEANEYNRQFFEPYKDYPAPIFAIAGNHDGDVNPAAATPYKSLDAFMRVFCDTAQLPIDLSGNSNRKTMIQPNVYYTLETPLATFICLYSNVPKFGKITSEQRDWFIEELKAAAGFRKSKALIVCIHHAPYSADSNHGSSRAMINFLEDAYLQAGVKPDIVFSGHVHNYQRFNKTYEDGVVVPYIVAGAGGYVTLFPVVTANQVEFISDDALLNDVQLAAWCDSAHGFLKLAIEKTEDGLTLTGEYHIVPYAVISNSQVSPGLFDKFVVNLLR